MTTEEGEIEDGEVPEEEGELRYTTKRDQPRLTLIEKYWNSLSSTQINKEIYHFRPESFL